MHAFIASASLVVFQVLSCSVLLKCCPDVAYKEKHNLSLIQHRNHSNELEVSLVNWADIGTLFGQQIFLDPQNRAKTSVFGVFPNRHLQDVTFIQPDIGVYPRKWSQAERPQMSEITLRLKRMWAATIDGRCVDRCQRCLQMNDTLRICVICLQVYHDACSKRLRDATAIRSRKLDIKLPQPFRESGATCNICAALCDGSDG